MRTLEHGTQSVKHLKKNVSIQERCGKQSPHSSWQLSRAGAAGVASPGAPWRAARGSGLTACPVGLQAALTMSNTQHLWLCLRHLAMDLSSQPPSLQLLSMVKEPISCRGPLLHAPKGRGPQLSEGQWGGQGVSAGSAQPRASRL